VNIGEEEVAAMAQPAVEMTDFIEPGRQTGMARMTRATNMAGVTGAIRGRIRASGAPVGLSATPEPPEPAVAASPVIPAQATGEEVGQSGGAPRHAPADLDATLVLHHGRWTAQRALAELPDTPAATIEVIDGSLVVSPRRGIRHQTVVLEFGIALKPSARAAGYGTHPQVKIVVDDELVCPDLAVSTRLGEDTSCVAAHEVLMVADVILADQGRPRRMDRTPIYAAGNIAYWLRLDFRGHDPVISLHHLVEGEYQPVAVASVGSRFTTSLPFPFEIDPAELRGRLVQPRVP
jgi:hypothetical protein